MEGQTTLGQFFKPKVEESETVAASGEESATVAATGKDKSPAAEHDLISLQL